MSVEREGDAAKPAARRRGGLGRGLGALIPDGPQEQRVPENPLDVLFPDRGAGAGEARERGGSMRDLLSPPGRSGNVSRETIGRGSVRQSPPTTPNGGEQTGGTWGVFPSESAPAASNGEADVSRETSQPQDGLVDVPGAHFASVPVDWIIPNLKQPRSVFEQTDLDELAASIGELGVLQPVVVRTLTPEILEDPEQRARLVEESKDRPDARYELVMGERRWRAAIAAGLASVPAIVRETAPDKMLREALVENLHRVQLNPLEEAAAYSQLIEDFGYTQEELSRAVSKSRPQVANTLRLLNLPPQVAQKVAADVLSAGHARALLSLASAEAMVEVAERIVREGLSVRATEELVRAGSTKTAKRASHQRPPSRDAIAHAARISEILDTFVKISQGKQKGRLMIDYADEEDLARIVQILLGGTTTR